MSKRICVISSSPRGGSNSESLCDEFLRGAREAGHKTEKIVLSEKTFGYCRGCGVCNETHVCVQRDDMADILDRMVEADVIVLATPVYFYTPCAQMKTLIDRTAPRYAEIRDKDFYFIATMADPDEGAMDRTFEGLRGFTTECLPGAREKGVLRGCGVQHAGDIRHTETMRQAFDMGRRV